jgi:hypothetical protein
VNCERVQLVLSARMDGERVGARQAEAAVAHAERCEACRAFAERSARVRSSVRIRVAEPVPDLVEPIMATIARERIRPADAGRIRRHRPRHRLRTGLAPAAAAAIAGLVLGSVIVGGPWQRPADRPIAAAAVVRNVREAAPALDAFHGTYSIRELGFSPDVPARVFDMDVAFLSPQRFRLEVRDRTAYPAASWTPTDLTYIEDVTTTYTSGPSGCPGDLPPGVCPHTRATVTRLSEFSAAAPLPADLVLPVATFGSEHGFEVLGSETFGEREAVQLRLSFARAAPMFPFLRIGGSWRPFFDRDRVVLWLDADTWLPLRYVVYPSSSPERRAWELRYGRPVEPTDVAILDVRMVSASLEPPHPSLFDIPGAPAGSPPSLAEVRAHVGYLPATPAAPGNLQLVSIALPAVAADVTPRSLLVYADGLDYLRLGEGRGWTGPDPFGPVGGVAQQVALPGGGVGYYEPAGEGFGRRLAIHAETGDLYLETNLPRERLLAIASSLPVRGIPLPLAWRTASARRIEVERIGVEEALATAALPASLTSSLPDGYVVASAERSSIGSALAGVTFHLRQRDMDAAGVPLILHVEPGAGLPRPSSAAQSRVTFGDRIVGRWTPARSQLEWTGAGGYRSLQGELELPAMLSIAEAIAGAER